MAHGQAEGAEVHLSQALVHQVSLEASLGQAEGSEEAETVLDLLFSLLVERLQNAWTLQQPVRPSVSRMRSHSANPHTAETGKGYQHCSVCLVLDLLSSLLVERLQNAWILQQPVHP